MKDGKDHWRTCQCRPVFYRDFPIVLTVLGTSNNRALAFLWTPLEVLRHLSEPFSILVHFMRPVQLPCSSYWRLLHSDFFLLFISCWFYNSAKSEVEVVTSVLPTLSISKISFQENSVNRKSSCEKPPPPQTIWVWILVKCKMHYNKLQRIADTLCPTAGSPLSSQVPKIWATSTNCF